MYSTLQWSGWLLGYSLFLKPCTHYVIPAARCGLLAHPCSCLLGFGVGAAVSLKRSPTFASRCMYRQQGVLNMAMALSGASRHSIWALPASLRPLLRSACAVGTAARRHASGGEFRSSFRFGRGVGVGELACTWVANAKLLRPLHYDWESSKALSSCNTSDFYYLWHFPLTATVFTKVFNSW